MAEATISEAVLARRPELLLKLREEEERVWPGLCKTMAISSKAEQFASRLKARAVEGQWSSLGAYAENLDQQIQEFDLARLPQTLNNFPVVLRSSREHSTPSHSDGSTASCVLVVDDITKNLQVVGTMLRNAGYAVMPATSGAKALEGVQLQLPDLILLDVMMLDMDGLEVCRRLKADPLTQAIPVIFLTASNEMEHLVQGFEVGAVDYVTKPFNPPELLARVRTHLELKHARQRLREMNEEKNEFMGIAAHDLRNPLSAIKGFSELIVEDAQALGRKEAPDPEACFKELEDFGERIGATTGRMMEMLQNLLDANRIERGEMEPQPGADRFGPAVNPRR